MRQKSLRERTVKPGTAVQSGGVDGILASLYHGILFSLNINATRFNILMEQFLSDKQNGLADNIRDRSNIRGNLRKELLRSHMTWKVFCKGLLFLDVPSFEVVIRLHHRNKSITEHSKHVYLTPEDDV